MKRSTRVILAGGAAAAVGLGAWTWHASRPPVPAQALPAVPVLADHPARLATLLAEAEARARSPRTALEGTAELGRLYHANGFVAEAEACWRALHAAQPREARWVYYLADLQSTVGNIEGFEVRLRETIDLDPAYAPARLKLAELAFKTGRTEEAAGHYRARLQRLPGDPYARLGLIRVARQLGRHDEADRALAELVRDHPGFPPAHNLHAEVLAAQGDEAGARRHRWLGRETGRFREADDPWLQELNAWCYDPRRLAVLGTAEFQLARGDRGRALIERAVHLSPDDPGLLDLLGDLYLKLNLAASAQPVLVQALRLRTERGEPPPVETVLNLVESLRQLGRSDEALRVVADALVRGEDRFELHLARGVILDGLDRVAEAEAALREAVRRAPEDTDANYNLALVLLQQERRAEAARHLEAALFRQPTFPKALALLAQLELEAGRLDAAGAYVRPLYDANPGQPEVQALAAYWRLQSGLASAARRDTRTAEAHYRAGLEAQPENVDLLISLGALLVADGRYDEADGPLTAYRRLRPQEAQGALLLGEAALRRGRRDEAVHLLNEAEQLAVRAGQTQLAQRSRALLGR